MHLVNTILINIVNHAQQVNFKTKVEKIHANRVVSMVVEFSGLLFCIFFNTKLFSFLLFFSCTLLQREVQTLPETKNHVWPLAKPINNILFISKKQVDSVPMELGTTTSQLSWIVKMLLQVNHGLIQ